MVMNVVMHCLAQSRPMEIYIVTRSLAQCRPLVIDFFKLVLARSRPLENVVFRIGLTGSRCGDAGAWRSISTRSGWRSNIQLGGAPHHSRALRQDREVVEDGDLKEHSLSNYQLLTSPDGRDASLGSWRLAHSIGAADWRSVEKCSKLVEEGDGCDDIDVLLVGYTLILCPRLKIAAPENGSSILWF